MTDKDASIWFEPKRYGLGIGVPVTWQGWLTLALHCGVMGMLFLALRDRPAALITALLVAALLPLPFYGAHVRGGLRWRWGSDS